MSNLTQSSVSEGAFITRLLVNTHNPFQQVEMMSQSCSSIKPKVDYAERFPKTFILSLSCLQLLNSAAAIITDIVLLSSPYPLWGEYGVAIFVHATGIWCGIFYGLSAFFGVFASLRPSKPTIVAFMVTTFIASIFCLPGLIIPLLVYEEAADMMWKGSTVDDEHIKIRTKSGLGHAMIVIQIAVTFVQAGVAIASSVMTCIAVCPRHLPMREDRAVNDTFKDR